MTMYYSTYAKKDILRTWLASDWVDDPPAAPEVLDAVVRVLVEPVRGRAGEVEGRGRGLRGALEVAAVAGAADDLHCSCS